MNEDALIGDMSKTGDDSGHAGAGNPSYAGYEYQIEVTAWLALDLFLDRGVADTMSIEGHSREDVETRLAMTVGSDAANEGRSFWIQVKSRSTGPWTAGDFQNVLTGEGGGRIASADGGSQMATEADRTLRMPPAGKEPRKKPGPGKRDRPLDMLKADARCGYVFLTDAAVDASLMRFGVKRVGEESGASKLPRTTGRKLSNVEEAAIAGRIALIAGLSRELIEARTRDLLLRKGHVPSVRSGACRAALISAIRKRLSGVDVSPLRRVEVVDIISRHDGSLVSTVPMDYVAPACLPEIEEVLARLHAVIIVGPVGTGKTTTADVLERRFRDGVLGFETVDERGGLAAIASKLRTPDPVVFHLEDPWGDLRFLQASMPWTHGLAKLFQAARPDKKFVVTTRSDVLNDAGGLVGALAPYIVSIDQDDYDERSRATIYDNFAARLPETPRRTAARFRKKALQSLRTPFEIDRFFASLVLPSTLPTMRFEDLIRQSQVVSIARAVAGQIRGGDNPDQAIEAATVVWGLAAALGTVPKGLVATVRRRMSRLDRSFKAEVEAFVGTMIQARNLKLAAGSIAMAHPLVEQGFREAMIGHANKVEGALDLLVRALIDLGSTGSEVNGRRIANELRAVLPVLEDTVPEFDPTVVDALDKDLEHHALTVDGASFPRALDRLALLAAEASAVGRLARLLRPKRQMSPRGGDYPWTLSANAMDATADLSADGGCRAIVRRMIVDVLPSTSTSYDGRLVGLLKAIDPGATAVFAEALTGAAIGRFDNPDNLAVVVEGALDCARPPYEEVLSAFLAAQHDLDEHRATRERGLHEAHQKILDEAHGRHLIDEACEDGSIVEEGFQATVGTIRRREGYGWLAEHPAKARLLAPWLRALREPGPSAAPGEIAALLDLAASGEERAEVWMIAASAPSPEIKDSLMREVARARAPKALRHALLSTLMASDGAGWKDILADVSTMGPLADARRLELAFDLASMRLDDEEGAIVPAAALTALLDAWADDVSVSARMIVGVAKAGPEPEGWQPQVGGGHWARAAAALNDVAPDVGAAILAAMPAEAAPVEVLERYVGAPCDDAALAAVAAVVARGDASGKRLLERALGHASRLVRREALVRLLPSTVESPDRLRLSRTAAGDESSVVRLAFARAMADRAWPEGRDALCDLLGDRRDFSDMYTQESGSSFDVARAAAKALGAQDHLDAGHVAALRKAVDNPTDDVEVALEALRVLAQQPSDETGHWILEVAGRTSEAAHSLDLAWEAFLALARRGEAGMPLEDQPSLDALVDASLREESNVAVAALLAASANVDVERMERLTDALSADARGLFVVMVMLIRGIDHRERLASRIRQSGSMADRLADAIHLARGEDGDAAAVAAALGGRREFADWAANLGVHPAETEMRSVLDTLGLWRVDAPPTGDGNGLRSTNAFMASDREDAW